MKTGQKKVFITFVTLILVGLFILFFGSVNVSISNNSVSVKGTFVGGTTIPLNEITSIEYVDSLDIGIRKFGMGTFKMACGTYRNERFGSYKLYSYAKVNAFVIIHYDDKTLVFNQSDAEKTKELYDRIKEINAK
ncbi:PH domain-containing protein [Ruminiclostridium josui]|uniref:PH domain-containing protein n=1 Tax=Ruminiclostridium josui TaxID=1499 RepID=UPI000463AFE0|nr:PH domain-containing protein [Ruminiclostridium josui]